MPFNKLDDIAICKIKPRFKLEEKESKKDIIKLILVEVEIDKSVKSPSVL